MDEIKPTDDAINKKRNESGEHGSIEAYTESEKNFHDSMETCPLGIVVMAANNEIVYINQAMLGITGYQSADDLKKVHLQQLYTPESYSTHLERKAKRLKGEKVPAEYEISIRRRDGEVRTLQVHQQEITWGGAHHYMTMYQDITERLKMEATIRYQADLVENMADAVVSIDKKNRLFSWNKGAEKIYGWSEEEAIGRELFEVVNPSNTTLSHEEFMQILRQTGSWSGEDLHHRRTGEEFPVLITASLIKDKNGNEIGAVTVFKDITERKNAEKALIESRQRFYGAFHDSPSMNAIVHSKTGLIIEANQAMLQVTGFGPEVIGKNNVLELNAWPDIEQRGKLLAELSRKGRLSNIELKFRMKNGDIRAFNANISLINLNKEPYYFVSMIDITTRKEAEAALLASEKRYRTMLDNMMEGCQIIDFSWRYTYMNDASAKLTRVAKETLLGQKITDVYPGIEATGIYAAGKRCMEQRVPVRMEYEIILADGTHVWLDSSIQPVPEGIFVLSLDITERRKMEDSLRYHASLVENVSDAIVSSDVNIKILTWNKAAEEMYGWREDEVIGKTVMEVTRSIPVNTAVQEIKESLAKNSHWRGEALHERKNGERINVMVSVSLIKDQNGKETGAVTIFKDITEEKKVEMAIHQSEERFRRIFQSGPLGIIFSTLDNQITIANARFCELTGYSEEELRDMTLQDFFSTEDAAEVKTKLVQLVRGDIPYFNIEGICRIKSGQTAWGSLTITLIRNNEGKPQGFVTMVQDISARKRSEDRINHLNLVLRSIRNINQLITREKDRDRLIRSVCDILVVGRGFHSVWIMLVDENKKPVNWAGTNVISGMEEMVEAFRNDNLPDCVRKAFTKNEVIITGSPLEQCADCPVLSKTPGIGSMTVRLECEGTLYGVLCGSMWHSVIKDEDEISLFSEVAADISFALRDIELGSVRDKLAQEQMRAAKLESIGTLAGGIAHDFNNLLTGIVGNIGLAKTIVQNNTEACEMLEEAEKAALRSRDLTQQLLTFARGGKPIKKVTDVADIIKNAATFALRGSKVKLELSLPEDLWMAEVDEGQIGQVIHNLVINAEEAMPLGGTLLITAKNTAIKRSGALPLGGGNYVQIDVADTGTGIPPENLQKIYEPYFTTKKEGSGLGLTSAYSIIKSHGGSLLAESKLHQGSIFHIYLPASRKTAKGEKKVTMQQSPQSGGKVLVMDDDEVIRKMLKNMLNLGGYQVELTADGAEALEKYKQAMDAHDPFDVVIMDLTIPGGMGGKEAIGKLREIDPSAAVIVSSGYATGSIMSEYKKYGFSAVIAKPYSIQQLQETITGLITKTK